MRTSDEKNEEIEESEEIEDEDFIQYRGPLLGLPPEAFRRTFALLLDNPEDSWDGSRYARYGDTAIDPAVDRGGAEKKQSSE